MVKLCSRDPAPPPLKYVQGGGGIFKDMAIHDLELARCPGVFLFVGTVFLFFPGDPRPRHGSLPDGVGARRRPRLGVVPGVAGLDTS